MMHILPPLPGPSLPDLHDDQQTMIGYRMGIYLCLSLFRLSLPLCNALLLVAMTATSKCVPADRSVDPVLLASAVSCSVPSVFRLGCNDLGCPSAPMSRLPVGIISFPPPPPSPPASGLLSFSYANIPGWTSLNPDKIYHQITSLK